MAWAFQIFFKAPFVILIYNWMGTQFSVIFLLHPGETLHPFPQGAGVNTPVLLPAAPIFCTQEFKWCFQLIEASFDVPEKQIPQSTPTHFGPDSIYLNKGRERSPCSLYPNSMGAYEASSPERSKQAGLCTF